MRILQALLPLQVEVVDEVEEVEVVEAEEVEVGMLHLVEMEEKMEMKSVTLDEIESLVQMENFSAQLMNTTKIM